MSRCVLAIMVLLSLAGCASKRPLPGITFDEPIEAVPVEEISTAPTTLIEIPKPIPFPGQLKPLPELSEAPTSTAPQASVTHANTAARIEPVPSGFINAVQVWPYTPGALYQLYTMPGKVTDIALQPGEDIIDISTPDPVRWIVGDTRSGEGAEERRHVVIKPTRADLQTNLAIFTTRRTYHLEVKATLETWMAAVSWNYPTDTLLALKAENKSREAAQPIAAGITLEHLKFRYAISGDDPAWRPLRAFDDTRKVYIQFPAGVSQGDMPPLFVIGPEGDAQLVNYRVRAPYYIVDRLFAAAELRLGGKRAQVVRIERTDLKRRTTKGAR